jgi:mannose-6-phosphate isomerase-like protein (cupin superfamily)
MTTFSLSFLVAVLALPLVQLPRAISAETPAKIDNDQVRVLFVTSPVGAKSQMHDHKVNRVMVYLDEGTMTLTTADGKVEKLKFKANQPLWSPASGMHISENTSKHPVRIVEIELKKSSGASQSVGGDLDPVKVDPKRYKVLFENDQVRVVHARYAPHEKGVLHEHVLNRVVVFLRETKLRVTSPTGEEKLIQSPAGDITWGGYAKHIEENLSDLPFEVIVTELKK